MESSNAINTADQGTPPFLLDVLALHSQQLPNKRAWTFLNDHGDIAESYTYLELDHVTDALAQHFMKNCGLNQGERVVLVFFPGLLFSISLLACFKAGLIAVPVFPPDPRRLKKDLDHFVSIQANCKARVALTHSPYNYAKKLAGIKSIFSSQPGSSWPEMTWIAVDDIISREKSKLQKSRERIHFTRRLHEVAFLQYTSGSTSEPKGVMISHSNLAHNLKIITAELKVDTTTINVSWLPQYHDMGLIGSYLGCVYCGGTGIYMSPISFLKDPNMWLETISKFKGTHTQAPNFAYALACRKFKESKVAADSALDLSTMRHMINAAEPVDAEAIRDFYETFSPYGLPPNVVVPTYGLAEHTVFVCSAGKTLLTLDKHALELGNVIVFGEVSFLEIPAETKSPEMQFIVGCGVPERADGVDMRIVDPVSSKCVEDNKVGEIWVNSPSKALGYWDNVDVSNEIFRARYIDDETKDDAASAATYLRTGDLGFMRNGELFICGRLKDLIIVRGSNHYPQDIERTAEKCGKEYIRAGCSAAFAVKHEATHTEAVVFLIELKPGVQQSIYTSLTNDLRNVIAKEHGIAVSTICLLEPRTIEKTTSGKIARAWCRRAFLNGTLHLLHRWDAPAGEAEGVPDADQYNEDANTKAGEGDSLLSTAGGLDPPIKADELRELPISDIMSRLERTLVVISSQSASALVAPVPTNASLVVLGLDSMTIVQFKGVFEKRFHCNVPDEFMFTEICTLEGLAKAVKEGHLTGEQRKLMESNPPPNAKVNSDGEERSTTIVQQRREPLCPWFTCCY